MHYTDVEQSVIKLDYFRHFVLVGSVILPDLWRNELIYLLMLQMGSTNTINGMHGIIFISLAALSHLRFAGLSKRESNTWLINVIIIRV
jgi:hypothetical protein